jgi:simple sugar transport system permease protein
MNELNTLIFTATPLVFAVIGETITEKAGVINLSMEGSLMLSAMAGFVIAFETNSLLLGFLAGAIVGLLVALLIAFSSIRFKLNQVAVGFVLFQLCVDLSTFLGNGHVRIPGPTVQAWSLPLLEDIPVIGPIFFQQNLLVYVSYLLIFGAWWFMFRTRPGLGLQGVGERPEAAHSRGIPVNRMRYLYTALGGALIGIGGASYSLSVKIGWSFQHTRNLGWIALAIVIFGGWQPIRAAVGAYIFAGLLTAAQLLQEPLPDLAQVLPIIPFPLMILTLVIIYSDWLRRLTDRFPTLRAMFAGEPPTAIGTVFETD